MIDGAGLRVLRLAPFPLSFLPAPAIRRTIGAGVVLWVGSHEGWGRGYGRSTGRAITGSVARACAIGGGETEALNRRLGMPRTLVVFSSAPRVLRVCLAGEVRTGERFGEGLAAMVLVRLMGCAERRSPTVGEWV